MVGAADAGLGEHQDRGRDAGVGPEHAAGQLDHRVELVLLDQDAPQILVRLGRAEQHAVRHDDGGAPAGLEQPQEQREEQQLGLLRLDDVLQILGGGLVVERAGERRIGEHQRVASGILGVVLGEASRGS